MMLYLVTICNVEEKSQASYSVNIQFSKENNHESYSLFSNNINSFKTNNYYKLNRVIFKVLNL